MSKVTSSPRRAMLHIGTASERNCRGIAPREWLQAGGIGMVGLVLPDAWLDRQLQAGPISRTAGPQPSCIFILLSGGPSHLETFDPKPSAPVNIRGPYGTISTNVPGIQINELLPALSQHIDKCA